MLHSVRCTSKPDRVQICIGIFVAHHAAQCTLYQQTLITALPLTHLYQRPLLCQLLQQCALLLHLLLQLKRAQLLRGGRGLLLLLLWLLLTVALPLLLLAMVLPLHALLLLQRIVAHSPLPVPCLATAAGLVHVRLAARGTTSWCMAAWVRRSEATRACTHACIESFGAMTSIAC